MFKCIHHLKPAVAWKVKGLLVISTIKNLQKYQKRVGEKASNPHQLCKTIQRWLYFTQDVKCGLFVVPHLLKASNNDMDGLILELIESLVSLIRTLKVRASL